MNIIIDILNLDQQGLRFRCAMLLPLRDCRRDTHVRP